MRGKVSEERHFPQVALVYIGNQHKRCSLSGGRRAQAYEVIELHVARRAPNDLAVAGGLSRVLRCTRRRDNKPMRMPHDSLRNHMIGVLALGEHRASTPAQIATISQNS